MDCKNPDSSYTPFKPDSDYAFFPLSVNGYDNNPGGKPLVDCGRRKNVIALQMSHSKIGSFIVLWSSRNLHDLSYHPFCEVLINAARGTKRDFE